MNNLWVFFFFIITNFSFIDAMLVARSGDLDKVKRLIKLGVKVDYQDLLGWTELHAAASGGHTEIVRELIKAGANLNIKNYFDETPLGLAVRNGKIEAACLLLEKGADPLVEGYSHKYVYIITTFYLRNMFRANLDESYGLNKCYVTPLLWCMVKRRLPLLPNDIILSHLIPFLTGIVRVPKPLAGK